MDKFQTIKNVLVKYLKRLSTLFVATLVFTYFLAMAVIPFYRGNYSWDNLQEVWHSWQGLNVGMLAFFSTFFLYKAAVYREEEKKKRDFKTAKAFLPSALSQLTYYLKYCADHINTQTTNEAFNKKYEELPQSPLDFKLPENNYEAIFRECINSADPDVAKHLSGILIRLQILNSRLFYDYEHINLRKNIRHEKTEAEIKNLTINIIEVSCFVCALWDFSRDEKEFSTCDFNKTLVRDAAMSIGLRHYYSAEFFQQATESIMKNGLLRKI